MRGDSRKAAVLDTAGLFVLQSLTILEDIWTVPEAVEEVLDEDSRRALELVASSGRLRVEEPSERSIERVLETIREKGLLEALSETDIRVLALALDLRERGLDPVIYSDDSFVHRVARYLGIECVSIKRRVSGRSPLRVYVCPVCGYKTLKRTERCPVCGSLMKTVSRRETERGGGEASGGRDT